MSSPGPRPEGRVTRAGLGATGRRVANVALVVLPLATLAVVLTTSWRQGEFAVDFHHELYLQAKMLLETGVPFDPADVVIDGTNMIFPPLATVAAIPLSLLPASAADIAMTAILIVAAAATLWVLDVRDWRVYSVASLWPPFYSGLQTANVTFLVSLLAALAWRYRHRTWLPGALIGLAIAIKLFPWPLVAWLVATRRYRAAAAAVAVGFVSIVAVAPLGSPVEYVRLMRRLGDVMEEHSYSVYVLLGADTLARGLGLGLGLIVLLVALRLEDRRSFTLSIAACLLLSPIVWLHYFQLLVVPLAIARPRLNALWFVPLLTWLVPFGYADPWQVALTLGVLAVVLAGILKARPAADLQTTTNVVQA